MKFGRTFGTIALLWAIAPFWVPAPADVSGRAWTPQDSVAVRYFVDDYGTGGVTFSPDGARFFFISYYGNVSCDCNISELSVFSTEEVQHALARAGSIQGLAPLPLRTLIRRSWAHKIGQIVSAQWESDGKSISFQGVNKRGVLQLYLLNVRSGKVTALTNWPHEVSRGSMVRAGDTVIANLELPKSPDSFDGYPAHAITRDELTAAMFPGSSDTWPYTFVSYRGGTPWELKATDANANYHPSLSNDGRMAVEVRESKTLPAGWTAYEKLSGRTLNPADAPRFIVIDAVHRRSAPVFDAPIGYVTSVGLAEANQMFITPQALWAADQKHVVLVNTALPLIPENPERTHMAYIVGYNAYTSKWELIEPLQTIDSVSGKLRSVTQVGWITPGKELLVGHAIGGQPAAGTVYVLKGDRWIGSMVASTVKLPPWNDRQTHAPSGGLSVKVQQSANEPPVMVASDGRHQLALTGRDPALDGIWWARQEPFIWKESSGKMETGGLLLPRDVKGLVPLVIQAYNYEPDVFHPDGPAMHAYAAQSLVARGMAVLNIDIPSEDVPPATHELCEFSDRVDSAIEALAGRGLIDRSRVGLIGFSRGGYNTYYAITHPGKNTLAAAVADDAFTGEYSLYLDSAAIGIVPPEGASDYGGEFWQNKTGWLKNETSFNVDQVQTPILFTIHNHQNVPFTFDRFGAFAMNHRPLDFLEFPNGGHNLSTPLQRLASYGASVDWMAYWLEGESPPDPATAARWASLRKQQQAVLDGLRATGKDVAPLPPLIAAP